MKTSLQAFLLLLALVGGPWAARAQAIYNGPGTEFTVSDSLLYVNGTFENEGTLLLLGGRLYLDNGDLLNTGAGDIIAKNSRVVLAGTSASLLTLNNDTLSHLRVDNTGGVTMGSGGVVRGGLRLAAGHLSTTASHQLRLLPSATVLGETDAHYLKGSVVQTRALSGSSPVDYSGLGFTVNPQGQSLTVELDRRSGLSQLNYSFGQNPEIPGNQGVDRIWRLSSPNPLAPPIAPINITLSWLPANDNGNNFGSTMGQVWRSTDNGATWQKMGLAQSVAGRTISLTTSVLNAWYTVSSTPRPLPVELTAFTAAARQLDAALAWTTASETNSDYFAIERSLNGQTWEEIARQAAAGQSSAPRPYTALDREAGRRADLLYYRLRQVDRDGSTHYSPVRPVTFAREALGFTLDAYPVPLQAVLTLDVRCPSTEPLEINLFDAAGRRVFERRYLTPGPINRYQLELPALPAGSYVLRATQGKDQVIRKLLKE